MSWIRKVKKRSRKDLTGKFIVFINSHAEFHHGYIRHFLYSWEFYLGNFRTERSWCLQLRNGLRQHDVSKSLYERRRGESEGQKERKPVFQSVHKLVNPGEDQTGVVIMPFRNFSAGVNFFFF